MTAKPEKRKPQSLAVHNDKILELIDRALLANERAMIEKARRG